MWGRAAAKQGLKGLRQYDLRHYHASNMLTRGLSLTEVAFELGDSELTVRTVYGHLVPGQTESKRKRMDDTPEDPPEDESDKPAAGAEDVA